VKPASPGFDLVLPTLGRYEEVRLFLQRLANQTCPNFRVLLVDQNEPGFLQPVVDEFKDRLDLLHLRSPPGASRGRNAGIAHLQAEFVAFPDDDCFYNPDTLERAEHTFASDSKSHLLLARKADPGAYPLATSVGRSMFAGRHTVFRGSGTCFQFMRREVVDAVGPFDDTLGPGAGTPYLSGEDSDYVIRAVDLGFKVKRCPEIVVFHPPFDLDAADAARKAELYGRGRARLLVKHGFGFWFKALNIAYPLARLALSPWEKKRRSYYWAMFRGRLQG
jgi:GT2 family glycosyltransferase